MAIIEQHKMEEAFVEGRRERTFRQQLAVDGSPEEEMEIETALEQLKASLDYPSRPGPDKPSEKQAEGLLTDLYRESDFRGRQQQDRGDEGQS